MFQYHCLNPIAEKGLGLFDEEYKKSEDLQECDAVLVRSAKMHDMELPESVKVIARAGAGVNNIPVKDCAEKGVVVFNTPGANANGVKYTDMTHTFLLMLHGIFPAPSNISRAWMRFIPSVITSPSMYLFLTAQKR